MWAFFLFKWQGLPLSNALMDPKPLRCKSTVSPRSKMQAFTESRAMLTTVVAIKFIAEMGLLAFMGQGVLAVLVGAGRKNNVVYQLFVVLTRPFVKAVHFITPPAVLARHRPLMACCLLTVVWLTATFFKISWCLQIGTAACR